MTNESKFEDIMQTLDDISDSARYLSKVVEKYFEDSEHDPEDIEKIRSFVKDAVSRIYRDTVGVRIPFLSLKDFGYLDKTMAEIMEKQQNDK